MLVFSVRKICHWVKWDNVIILRLEWQSLLLPSSRLCTISSPIEVCASTPLPVCVCVFSLPACWATLFELTAAENFSFSYDTDDGPTTHATWTRWLSALLCSLTLTLSPVPVYYSIILCIIYLAAGGYCYLVCCARKLLMPSIDWKNEWTNERILSAPCLLFRAAVVYSLHRKK